VARLVERPDLMKLGGEARELTLMFTDLANYFNAMTPIIHRHDGMGRQVHRRCRDGVLGGLRWTTPSMPNMPLCKTGHAAVVLGTVAGLAVKQPVPALFYRNFPYCVPPIMMPLSSGARSDWYSHSPTRTTGGANPLRSASMNASASSSDTGW
jgi:hypothetical protein